MSRTLKQLLFSIFTVVIYSIIFGWKIALLISITIGWHESSHLLAARHLKLKTGGFTLIPFFGGVSFVSERYKSYKQQIIVVLAGPIGGGILGLLVALVYAITGLSWLAVAASWMLFLNVANLIPLSFCDGGQLLGAITHSINRTLGMVLNTISTLVAVVLLWFLNPVIAMMIIIFGGSSVITEITNWKNYRAGKTYLCTSSYLNPPKSLSNKEMITTLGIWITTIIILGSAMIYVGKYFHLTAIR